MARFRPGDILQCATHRKTTWLGHVICDPDAGGCGGLHKNALTAPLVCDCDHRLLPPTRSPVDDDKRYSGRAICPHCYGAMKMGTSAPVAIETYET
jgi:hypothetical protein